VPEDITTMLVAWSNGDKEALHRLIPKVLDELHKLARYFLRNERVEHSLESTALINEAYLRLVDVEAINWQNRTHFFSVAAQLMRRILVDHARNHLAEKRGGGLYKIPVDHIVNLSDRRNTDWIDLVALDNALLRLSVIDSQQSKIIELRYFGGLSGKDIAELLGISPATVSREEKLAKMWLLHELSSKT
jgi:RNA polymerase sigma-70 factor, ECF subfamily